MIKRPGGTNMRAFRWGNGVRRAASLCLACLCLLLAAPGRAEQEEDVTARVLGYFQELAAIPRTSGHEEAVGDYLMAWAKGQGFAPTRDRAGNVIFDVPAASGYENAPRTVLQGHMDMVAVSDDPAFDPLTDPVTPVRAGDTLTGKGTSLGADNGAGLAVIMTYVSSDAPHGPLRVIVTVEEENDLSGVKSLDPALVKDAAYLFNLDNEAEGSACVSTAGHVVLTVSGKARMAEPTLERALRIRIDGLSGGHSGLKINAGKLNAIVTLSETLLTLGQNGVAYELASLRGRGVHNAIPGEAEAVITVSAADAEKAADIVREKAEGLRKTYAATDGDMALTAAPTALPEAVFAPELACRIVDFAALVPNGVNTMSQRVAGLVESSSNLGAAQADADGIAFTTCVRSSEQALMESVLLRETRLAALCGFTTGIAYGSDAWPVDADAKLPALLSEVYKEQTGKDLIIESVHAGLECGTFARMNEEIDMVCIGAQIDGAHTTKETLRISSVGTLYHLLAETLKRLK